MDNLAKFVVEYCIRGSCICGKCSDTLSKKFQPDGHTVDLQFFKVALKNNPSINDKEIIKNEFIRLIKNHRGTYKDVDLFDGNEHNFIEIGGWIGNQGLGLMLMGIGELLDLWTVSTPNRIAPDYSEETKIMLAETGYISIKYNENYKGKDSDKKDKKESKIGKR